ASLRGGGMPGGLLVRGVLLALGRPRVLGTRVRLGQHDGEGRALAGGRPEFHRSPVIVDDVLDDAQAEAGTAGLTRTGLVTTEEPLEHPVPLLGRDPLALVDDGDAYQGVVPGDADGDPSRRAGVPDRVVQQVTYRRGQQGTVAVDLEATRPSVHQRHTAGLR